MNSFLVKLSIVLIAVVFCACQNSDADNLDRNGNLLDAKPPINAIDTPQAGSPIRNIDFKNFTYQWTEELTFDDKSFSLIDGELPSGNDQIGVSFVSAEYGDVTGDGQEEAMVNLVVQTGGSAIPNMINIYALENGKPKLLWNFDTGDRAEGGFKRVYEENGNLVVETFGQSKFENRKWKFDLSRSQSEGFCCPKAYTIIRFKWTGKKFITVGKPEIFDYDFFENSTSN